MSLGIFAFRLSVSTKHLRRSDAFLDLPLDLLITQSGENLHTQNARNIGLNHQYVKMLNTQDYRLLLTQDGNTLNTVVD